MPWQQQQALMSPTVSWDALLESPISLDLTEAKDRFTLAANIKGFSKDQLKVDCKDGMLTISGEKASEKKGDGSYEQSSSSFSRSLSLPASVDESKISAKFVDGALAIDMKKLPEGQVSKKGSITIS
jgi:HSP20 family protein